MEGEILEINTNTNQVANNGGLQTEITADDFERTMQELRNNQSIVKGLIGGLIAAIIGAAIWAGITVITEYQIGWMAIGVGFLVGQAVRIMGKGYDISFGIIGAILALFGCILGNLLAVCIVIANYGGVSIFSIFSFLDFEVITALLADTFQSMDLLFYGLAVLEGYQFSINKLVLENPTPEESEMTVENNKEE